MPNTGGLATVTEERLAEMVRELKSIAALSSDAQQDFAEWRATKRSPWRRQKRNSNHFFKTEQSCLLHAMSLLHHTVTFLTSVIRLTCYDETSYLLQPYLRINIFSTHFVFLLLKG